MGYQTHHSLERRSAPRGEALAVEAVVGALGAQVGGNRQVAARLGLAAGLRQRAAEAEMRVVVHRVALHHGLELLRRLGVAAAAEVGTTERLPDRAFLGIEPGGLAQRHRGLREIAALEQRHAPPVERVEGIAGAQLAVVVNHALKCRRRYLGAWLTTTASWAPAIPSTRSTGGACRCSRAAISRRPRCR